MELDKTKNLFKLRGTPLHNFIMSREITGNKILNYDTLHMIYNITKNFELYINTITAT